MQGKCTNFGNCPKADSREIITLSDGADLICPECGKDLTRVIDRPPPPPPLARIGVGALVLLLLLVGAWKLLSRAPSGTGSGGGGGIPPPDSNGVLMFFERSGLNWVTPAADAFGKTHTGAKIVLNPIGSYEGKSKILDAKEKPLPVIWNPGEGYWISKLSSDWANQHAGEVNVIGARYDILRTHYVFVMWEDRARVFEQAMQKPEYHGKTWHLIYTLATEGWGKIGGEATWGKLKLVHSNPMKSSSGLLSLGLMLAEYRREEHASAAVDAPGYLKLMKGVESCLVSAPDTTSLTTKAFTEGRTTYADGGPAAVDMIVAYEQNALELIKSGKEHIRLIYPEPVLSIKFPAVVLKANWVTEKQAQVGEDFIKYLGTREVQEKAIDSGFYPARPDLYEAENTKLDIPLYKQAGFRLRPESKILPVSQKDLEGVQYLWDQWPGHPH